MLEPLANIVKRVRSVRRNPLISGSILRNWFQLLVNLQRRTLSTISLFASNITLWSTWSVAGTKGELNIKNVRSVAYVWEVTII